VEARSNTYASRMCYLITSKKNKIGCVKLIGGVARVDNEDVADPDEVVVEECGALNPEEGGEDEECDCQVTEAFETRCDVCLIYNSTAEHQVISAIKRPKLVCIRCTCTFQAVLIRFTMRKNHFTLA